jgi:hypothetical protein
MNAKLYGSGQNSSEYKGVEILKQAPSLESSTHIIHQSRAFCWFYLFLLLGSSFVYYTLCSSLGPRYLVIILCYSLVILDVAFSTYLTEAKGIMKAGVTRKRVPHERE